jgi:hypothetical protein
VWGAGGGEASAPGKFNGAHAKAQAGAGAHAAGRTAGSGTAASERGSFHENALEAASRMEIERYEIRRSQAVYW